MAYVPWHAYHQGAPQRGALTLTLTLNLTPTLTMKARLNEERRAQRAAHRAKADALLAQGKRAEAVSAMSKAVGVRPHMTQQLIELCRARGVECIAMSNTRPGQRGSKRPIGRGWPRLRGRLRRDDLALR